jgi:hypothetical protein
MLLCFLSNKWMLYEMPVIGKTYMWNTSSQEWHKAMHRFYCRSTNMRNEYCTKLQVSYHAQTTLSSHIIRSYSLDTVDHHGSAAVLDIAAGTLNFDMQATGGSIFQAESEWFPVRRSLWSSYHFQRGCIIMTSELKKKFQRRKIFDKLCPKGSTSASDVSEISYYNSASRFRWITLISEMSILGFKTVPNRRKNLSCYTWCSKFLPIHSSTCVEWDRFVGPDVNVWIQSDNHVWIKPYSFQHIKSRSFN